METRKYLFETKFKQFLSEQAELRIGAATIQNPKMQGNSVEFKAMDLDRETYRDSGPLYGHDTYIIIRLNNLVKQPDGSYTIKSTDDIELPNFADLTNYQEYPEDLPLMQKHIDIIKDRLFFRFSD